MDVKTHAGKPRSSSTKRKAARPRARSQPVDLNTTKRPRPELTVQDVYDQNRRMVESVERNPDVPQYVKVHLRNLAGYMCAITGAGAMTMDAVLNNKPSPLGAMDPKLNVDFTPHMRDPLRR